MANIFKFTTYLGMVLLMQACASYIATSGKVAVKDDRPASKPQPSSVPVPANNARPAKRDTRVAMATGFSTRDRLSIEEYFEKQRSAQARQESLPASFAVHDRLPANIQGQSLPRALESRLTVLPDAYVRLQVGRDVLLMERDSRVVLDLLRDVIAP
jgi:hypothetical protein